MSIIENVTAALDDQRSADELDELAVELRTHTDTKVERLKAITAKDTSTFAENPGPERQQAIDDALRIRTAIDVVAHEHQVVVRCQIQALQQHV